MNLDHVMLIPDVTLSLNSGETAPGCILYNATLLEPEQAMELFQAGKYSPYMLVLPKEQFLGLFRNEVVASRREDPPDTLHLPAALRSGTLRRNLHPGDLVDIVLKKDQPTGKLTRGRVQDILTNSPEHHRGIKVRLQDGQIGRVKVIYGCD